jgi:ABC-type sugar transport system permease subunit
MRNSSNMTRKRQWITRGTMLALPAILIVLACTLLPFLQNFYYAFTNYSLQSTTIRFVGFRNFANFIGDKDFLLVVANTVKLFFVYTVGVNLVAITLSIMLSKVSRRFGTLIRSIIFFPYLLSLVAVGFLWRVMLNYTYGPINQVLVLLGMARENLPHWLGNTHLIIIPSLALVVVWFVAGYFTIIYYAGIMNIDPEYYSVAAIAGANSWQEIVYITLPFLAPSITVSTVLLSVHSLGAFALPMALLDGGGPGRYGTTISLWAYTAYYGENQYAKAIAISVILGVMAVAIAVIELKVLLRRETEDQ